ncbi:MAG: hypothetical protein WA774_04350, partial [Candidatus Acidiferrales bacterium]
LRFSAAESKDESRLSAIHKQRPYGPDFAVSAATVVLRAHWRDHCEERFAALRMTDVLVCGGVRLHAGFVG